MNEASPEKHDSAVKDGIIAILSIAALILIINFGIITFSSEKSNTQTILESVKLPVVISGTLIISLIIGGIMLSYIFGKTLRQSYAAWAGPGFKIQFWTFITGLVFMFVAILTRFSIIRLLNSESNR